MICYILGVAHLKEFLPYPLWRFSTLEIDIEALSVMLEIVSTLVEIALSY